VLVLVPVLELVLGLVLVLVLVLVPPVPGRSCSLPPLKPVWS
jgi:hypothetical protein